MSKIIEKFDEKFFEDSYAMDVHGDWNSTPRERIHKFLLQSHLELVSELKKGFYSIIESKDLSEKFEIDPTGISGGFIRVLSGKPYIKQVDLLTLADEFDKIITTKEAEIKEELKNI